MYVDQWLHILWFWHFSMYVPSLGVVSAPGYPIILNLLSLFHSIHLLYYEFVVFLAKISYYKQELKVVHKCIVW